MSFADRDGVIWLDGELIQWRDAKVHSHPALRHGRI
jgi:branched-chain amino acid aminotransferase